jgi:hypothetical protein
VRSSGQRVAHADQIGLEGLVVVEAHTQDGIVGELAERNGRDHGPRGLGTLLPGVRQGVIERVALRVPTQEQRAGFGGRGWELAAGHDDLSWRDVPSSPFRSRCGITDFGPHRSGIG